MLRYVSALPAAAIATIAISSFQAAGGTPETLAAIEIDINADGVADRVVLFRSADGGDMDLAIYYNAGSQEFDASQKPDFIKLQLAPAQHAATLEKTKRGALIVKYGLGGVNSYEGKLTIVSRNGKLLVAGYTLDWDTKNSGIGHCDINFLTGKGFTSSGLNGKRKNIGGNFRPVDLSVWSTDKQPAACRP
jgi:hypothetical protein